MTSTTTYQPKTKPVSTPQPGMITFMTLRKWVGFLGIGLVPIVVLGSFILDHTTKVQTSVSAYYFTSMRNELEGILCAIGVFMLCYHGYTRQDSIVSKLAGFFALCIALLPTSATDDKSDIVSILHYVTAGIFFTLLAYESYFLFTKTAGYITVQKIQRNRVYRTCAIVMAIACIGIPLDGIKSIEPKIGFLHPTLILETIALTAFGISWLTKGEVILKDKP